MAAMKKSARVTLTVVAAVAMASCARRRDPCESMTFDAQACQDAVSGGGYYYGGSWFPMRYAHPYPYFYDGYSHFLGRGGRVSPAPSGMYSHPSGSSHGVSRGGFGSTGSHFGGHGVGS